MLGVLSRQQSREFDRISIEEHRVPGLVLMENAGRGATDVLLARFPNAKRVFIACGFGNNAGDGFVVGRHLLTRGVAVRVVSLCPIAELGADARANAEAYVGVGGELAFEAEQAGASSGAVASAAAWADLIVDALFGTGLSRPVRGLAAEVIHTINSRGVPKLALDLPSGVDADTGCVLGAAVRADLTVSFASAKLGLFTHPTPELVGELRVVDLGVPRRAVERTGHAALLLEAADAAAWIRQRKMPGHKGQAGRVLAIAGGPSTVGAARLCALGAHRAGAGLVTIASFPEVVRVLESTVFETMTHRLDPARPLDALQTKASWADAIAIGPGLGLSSAALTVIEHVVLAWPGTVVVDADALSALASIGVERLVRAAGPRILTPHPAEAARLLGETTESVQADRFHAAQRLADVSGATVLLKGRHSLIARSGREPWINPTGNAALAVGGTGDVLCGMIAAFTCALDADSATALGAWAHGRVAELWVERHGTERGMLASDVAEGLPDLFGAESLG